jgi:uncharacterized membrane protein YhfC
VNPQLFWTWSISLVIMILGPLALASWFWSRFRPSLRAFALGATVFAVFQLVLRLPLTSLIGRLLGDTIKSGAPLYLYLTGMAFSAGLFESVGRWAGYRWVFPPRLPYDWKHAVAYGIGHGGFESMVLVGGLSLLNLVQGAALLRLSPDQLQSQFSGDTLAKIMSARELFLNMAWYEPLLAAVERIATVPFHIAMSLMVLLVFTRGQLRWLWYAVILHGLADLTAVLMMQRFRATPWVVEAAVGLWGIASVWYILRRYREEQRAIQDTGEIAA